MSGDDYYAVLQVSPGASQEEVQAAYRALCKKYHPDTRLPTASLEMMKVLNEAHAVLSDRTRRSEYDDSYRRGQQRRRTIHRRAGDRELVLTPDIRIPLARVPAGDFLMGGPSARPAKGQEQVWRESLGRSYLPEYFIAIYPVTVAEYAAFAAATHRPAMPWANKFYAFDMKGWDEFDVITRLDRNWRHPFGEGSSVIGKEQHPVSVVNWHDAVAFCRWASERTGQHVRLPTAAEWQKASRGRDGRPYPWGDAPEPNSRFCNCLPPISRAGPAPQGDTTPVGGYSPRGDSPYGCADMLGNVWEWTSSSVDGGYVVDHGAPAADPRAARVLYGGSFMSASAAMSCAAARILNPLRARDTGFRVCISG